MYMQSLDLTQANTLGINKSKSKYIYEWVDRG